MKKSLRPALTAGVAVMSAVTVAIAPSVKAPAPTAPTTSAVRVVFPAVELAAAVQPRANPTEPQPSVAETQITQASLPNLLVDFLRRIVVPPSASAPFPTPQFPPVVGGNSVQSTIKNIYNAVEPWVEWGFEVAAYAVGWVPYVGWLAPQIMYFYYLGERIVQSITFNIADWIGGDISFVDGLVNVGVDTINSFIFFANDQLAFWLPPLPPIPPIGPFAAVETAELTEPIESMAKMSADIADDAALDVVEVEGAIVETDVVDAAVTEDETQQDDTQQIDTEGAVTEATLEEEPAVEDGEDEVTEKEPTTSSSGTVQAQGEVRDAGISASPDETADDAVGQLPEQRHAASDGESHRSTAGQRRLRTGEAGQLTGFRWRHSTRAGGSEPSTISSSAAYSITPAPPNTMSSPGPPMVSTATVSSQVHNGSAASRGADVHCSAAHTSAALSRPLSSALMGNGTGPMRSGRKNAAANAESTPSMANSVSTTTRLRSVADAGGVRSGCCRARRRANRSPTGNCRAGPANAAGWDRGPGPLPSLRR